MGIFFVKEDRMKDKDEVREKEYIADGNKDVDGLLEEILKEVETGKMGSKDIDADFSSPIYEVPSVSSLKTSSDLTEVLFRLKDLLNTIPLEDLERKSAIEAVINEIEKEIKRREKQQEKRVIEKLYRVTRESEEHGTKLMSKLETLLDAVNDALGILDGVESKDDKMSFLKEKLCYMNDIIFDMMGQLQYQDVLRQKIERVVVALKRLNDYLNEWFGSDIIGD